MTLTDWNEDFDPQTLDPMFKKPTIAERLEYLRSQIDAEQISYGELLELQGLADQIEPGDVQLLEWAGVEEFPAHDSCGSCGADLGPSTEFPWHLPDEDCRAIRKPTES